LDQLWRVAPAASFKSRSVERLRQQRVWPVRSWT
jgi:hypothetical protein